MSYIVKLSQTVHYEYFAECNSAEEAKREALAKLSREPNPEQTYYFVVHNDGFKIDSVDLVNASD